MKIKTLNKRNLQKDDSLDNKYNNSNNVCMYVYNIREQVHIKIY